MIGTLGSLGATGSGRFTPGNWNNVYAHTPMLYTSGGRPGAVFGRYGDAGGAGANTSLRIGYYLNVGGWYYRYDGTNITIVRAPAGYVAGRVLHPGESVFNAVYDELLRTPSSFSTYLPSSTGPTPVPGSAQPSVDVSDGQAPATTVKAGFDWANFSTGLTTALMPLFQLGVSEAVAGGRNTEARLASQIASKRAELARTSDPGRIARLRSEIASLEQQLTSYRQTVATTGSDGGSIIPGTTGSTSNVPWLGLGVAIGLPVFGLLAWAALKPEHAEAA